MKLRSWSLIALVLAVLVLLGCGGMLGGGGDSTRLSITDVAAKVILPAGPAGSLADLKVWTSVAEDSPQSNGDVAVKVYNNGPQYTEVRNAAGKMVAAGFIGGARSQLSLESTAELLVYFAVGGPLQRGSANSQSLVLAAAKSFPGYANVVTAVTNTFNANGFVSSDDPEVVAALESLRNGMLTGRAASSRGPEITPTKEASGLELADNVNDQVTIKNTFFRRGHLWLERTGYKDTSGASHVSRADIADKPIAMPIRYGGTIDSATGLIEGQYEWLPATMEPLATTADLPSVSNEEEVFYTLTTVGIGTLPGDFLELTGDQINRWEELVYNTTYLDFFLPIFANLVLPLDGTALDDLVAFNESHQTVRDWVTAARSGMPQISSLTAQGKFPQAVSSFVGSSQLPSIIEMAADVTTEWGEGRGSSLFKGQQDLLNRIKQASNNIGMVRLADVVAEMAPLADIANSHQADIFKIVSRKSSVKLVAEATEVGLTDTADIECIIKSPEPGAPYRFEWSVNNSDFFLQDVDGNSTDESPGGVLKSAHAKVFIGNLTNHEGTPVATCKVYLGQTLIGAATTSVAFKKDLSELNGRIIYKSRYKKISTNGWNWSYACIAEIDKVPNAADYKMTVTDASGKVVKVKNWLADTPPAFYDATMYESKPANVYWIEIESGTGAGHGFSGADGGEAEVRDYVAGKLGELQTKHTGDKCRVTVTMK